MQVGVKALLSMFSIKLPCFANRKTKMHILWNNATLYEVCVFTIPIAMLADVFFPVLKEVRTDGSIKKIIYKIKRRYSRVVLVQCIIKKSFHDQLTQAGSSLMMLSVAEA